MGSVIFAGGLALPTLPTVLAQVVAGAGAGAGVEAAEVALVGAGVLPLVALTDRGVPVVMAGDGRLLSINLSMSFSDRNMVSFKFKMCTPVATNSRVVGNPSIMVMRRWVLSSWNNSSRKGAYPES